MSRPGRRTGRRRRRDRGRIFGDRVRSWQPTRRASSMPWLGAEFSLPRHEARRTLHAGRSERTELCCSISPAANVLELNESGKVIWQLALAGQSEAAIAAALVSASRPRPRHRPAARAADALNSPRGDAPGAAAERLQLRASRHRVRVSISRRTTLVVDDRGEHIIAGRDAGGCFADIPAAGNRPEAPVASRSRRSPRVRGGAGRPTSSRSPGSAAPARPSTARAFGSARGPVHLRGQVAGSRSVKRAPSSRPGERAVGAWAAATAEALRSSQPATCAGLDRAMQGETMRARRNWIPRCAAHGRPALRGHGLDRDRNGGRRVPECLLWLGCEPGLDSSPAHGGADRPDRAGIRPDACRTDSTASPKRPPRSSAPARCAERRRGRRPN